MKWFYNIDDVEILRKEYKKLVVKYQPDNGGSEADCIVSSRMEH